MLNDTMTATKWLSNLVIICRFKNRLNLSRSTRCASVKYVINISNIIYIHNRSNYILYDNYHHLFGANKEKRLCSPHFIN